MTIILTVNYSPWSRYSGGGQRCTHNLAAGLSVLGCKVHVIYTKGILEKITIPDDLPYHVHWANFPAFTSHRKNTFRFCSGRTIQHIIEREIRPKTPFVLHSNGEEAHTLSLLRNHFRFYFVGSPHYSHYPLPFENWQSLSSWQKNWLRITESKYVLQGKVLRDADLVCPPSLWAAETIAHVYQISDHKIQAVPNGVPDEFLEYTHTTTPLNNGPIVFFGRLSHAKGIDTLMEALSKMSDRRECLIIGEGDEKQALQKKISRLGLSGSVTFHPWMNHHELGDILSRASVCVLPSRDENYSLAILGAMAVGVPVISTRIGGTPEIIEHKKTGYLISPDHPQELAATIEHVLSNPNEAQHIGKSGSEWVRTNRTWKHTSQKFIALYTEGLSQIYA